MIKVLRVGDPNLSLKHYVFSHHIVRVSESGANSCVIHLIDGKTYNFGNSAREVVAILTDEADDELQKFLDMPLGTEVEQ